MKKKETAKKNRTLEDVRLLCTSDKHYDFVVLTIIKLVTDSKYTIKEAINLTYSILQFDDQLDNLD